MAVGKLIGFIIVISIWAIIKLLLLIFEKKRERKLNQLSNFFIANLDPSLSIEEKLEMAEDFIKKEDYDKAIMLCANILAEDKDCAMAYCLKAEAGNYGSMKSEEAMKSVEKAIELDPSLARAYYIRGIVKNNSCEKNTEEFEMENYSKAIELDPNFSEAYLARGILRRDMDDIEGAISDFTSAAESDPNNYEAYWERGDTKYNLKDYYGALADYEKVLAINPKARTNINKCLSEIKKAEKAL